MKHRSDAVICRCCRLSLLDQPNTHQMRLSKTKHMLLTLRDPQGLHQLRRLQQNQPWFHPFHLLSFAFIFPFPILYHLVLHQAINPLKQSLCGAPCLRGNSGDTWQLWRSNDIYDIYLFLTYLQCVYIVQRFHTDLILSWKLVQIVGQVLSGRTTRRHLLRRSGELRKVLSLTWRIWTYLNYIRKDITSQWPRNNPKQSWNVINTVTLG